jgi:hypothetical protein
LSWFPDEYLPPESPVVLLELARTFTVGNKIWPPRCKEIYFLGLVHASKGSTYRRVGLAVFKDSLSQVSASGISREMAQAPYPLLGRQDISALRERQRLSSRNKDDYMTRHVMRIIPISPQGDLDVYWSTTTGRLAIV